MVEAQAERHQHSEAREQRSEQPAPRVEMPSTNLAAHRDNNVTATKDMERNGSVPKATVDRDRSITFQASSGTHDAASAVGSLKELLHRAPDASTSKDDPQAASKAAREKLFSRSSTPEERLQAAHDLYQKGERKVEGTDKDGRKLSLELREQQAGDRHLIAIFGSDEKNRDRVVMRGIVNNDGSVHQQQNKHGNTLDYAGDWWRKNQGDHSVFSSKPEEKKAPEVPAAKEKGKEKGPEGDKVVPATDDKTPNKKVLAADAAELYKITGGAAEAAKPTEPGKPAANPSGKPDLDTATKLLEGKTPAELRTISEEYAKQHPGQSLEKWAQSLPEGSTKERFLAHLGRQDGNEAAFQAKMVHASLTERGESFFIPNAQKDNQQIEASLRDKFQIQNPQQLEKINEEYKKLYGTTADQAIKQDPNVSDATKEAIAVYADNSDKNPDSRALRIANVGLRHQNFDIFASGMRSISQEGRDAFMAADGDKKLSTAFGNGSSEPNKQLLMARDLATKGEIDPLTHIKKETGLTSLTTSDKEISDSTRLLTDQQRSDFRIGRVVSGKAETLSADDRARMEGMTPAERQSASDFYSRYHETLSKAGNETKVAQWEAQIAHPDSKLLNGLEQHRGWVWNSSAADIKKSVVDNMTQSDWNYGKQHPEQAEELRQGLKSLGKTDKEIADIVGAYQAKVGTDKFQGPSGEQPKDDPTAKLPPEERLHAAIQNGDKDILERLKSVGDLDKARAAYTDKYKSSLDVDTLKALNGAEKDQASLYLANHRSGTDQLELQLDKYYQSRSGVGSRILESVGDLSHSAQKGDDIRGRAVKQLAEANRTGLEQGPERTAHWNELLSRASESHREGRATAAEVTTNTALIAGSTLVTIGSGGTAAPLLAAIAAGGGLKVGANKLFRGDDYTSNNFTKDFALGSAETALNVAGGGTLGLTKFLSAARTAAGKAVQAEGAHIVGQGLGNGAYNGFEASTNWDAKKSVSENLKGIATHAGEGFVQGAALAGTVRAGSALLRGSPHELSARATATTAKPAETQRIQGQDWAAQATERTEPKERFRAKAETERVSEPQVRLDADDQMGFRRYHVGDNHYNLQLRQGWFYGKTSPEISPLKLHVTTSSPEDLAKLQKVLIPFLSEDPHASKLAAAWKTFDPKHGLGLPDAYGRPPGLTDQGAKGFTIGVKNAKDAFELQARIDKYLTEKGLALKEPQATGNADIIAGTSNRVGTVRDHYPATIDDSGYFGIKLDEVLVKKIHSEYGAGQKLSEQHLRSVEQTAGLAHGTLAYDRDGELMLRLYHWDKPINGQVYVAESGAQKTFGRLTDRPAIYGLSKKFGWNPADGLIER